MSKYVQVGTNEAVIEVPAANGLVLSDSGGAFITISSGKATLANGNVTIFGWAVRPAGTISQDDPILVESVLGKTYRMPKTGSGSPAIGSRFGVKVTSNVQYVDTDETSNVVFEVVEIDGSDLIVRVI